MLSDSTRLGPSHRLQFCPTDRVIEQVVFGPGFKPLQGRPVSDEDNNGLASRSGSAPDDTADI
jgi:hypothetical protein